MRRIHIFRSGRHCSSAGDTITFDAADLTATADAYDPAVHEAPITVGHPSTDSPAYGWIGSLDANGSDLFATPRQVEPQFEELISAGRYKKVSASFYLPDASGNPKPGVYYLRHVGFLGAQPPAVKGLRAAEFAADDTGTIEIEFTEGSETLDFGAQFVGWMKRMFLADGADVANPAYAEPEYAGPHQSFPIANAADATKAWNLAGHAKDPDAVRWRIFQIAKTHKWTAFLPAAAKAWAKSHSIAFEEGIVKTVTTEELTRREEILAQEQTALDQQKASFAEQQRTLVAQQNAIQGREVAEFCEQLLKDGKLLPAEAPGISKLLISMPSEALEFSEGDATVKRTPDAILRALLTALPTRVDFTERTRAAGKHGAVQAFPHESGYAVDPDSAALRSRALAYAEAHKCSFVTAVKAVEEE